MSNIRSNVAANVRALRKARGLSQTDLADRMGAGSLKSISRLENGERGIDVEELASLAHALGSSPGELMAPVADEAADMAPVIAAAEEFQTARRRRELAESALESARTMEEARNVLFLTATARFIDEHPDQEATLKAHLSALLGDADA